MIKYITTIFRNFFLLFAAFFPLGFLGSFQLTITTFIFGNLVEFIAKNFFSYPKVRIDFSSDSLSMYILISCLFLISIVISSIKWFKTKPKETENLLAFYLAIVLTKYGIDKIQQGQFYIPEPNILFTRFGNLDKDILFWSTVGTSYHISLITGIIEVVIAVLLLLNRTRIIGAMLSCFVFLQILVINISFDISVKLFSTILLGISFYISRNYWIKLWHFLTLKNQPNNKSVWMQRTELFLKTFLVLFVIWKSTLAKFEENNFTNDLVKSPNLHGVYKNLNQQQDIKLVFFHTKEFIIFMDQNENQFDYKYTINDNKLFLENNLGENLILQFHKTSDSTLVLENSNIKLHLKSIDWKKSKVLQPLFHLLIEDVK